MPISAGVSNAIITAEIGLRRFPPYEQGVARYEFQVAKTNPGNPQAQGFDFAFRNSKLVTRTSQRPYTLSPVAVE